MVSRRDKKQEQSHLGLGPYLVKLIVESRVTSPAEGQTASFCFSVSLKRLPT